MRTFLILFLGLLLCHSSHAEPVAAKPEMQAHPLVTCQAGDLPIILSAPHGGKDAVPGVPPREGKGVARFNPKIDSHTAALTEKLADALERTTGKRPYVVIARFHRKFIDANRSPGSAYESEQAKPVYDAYQQALAKSRQDIIDRWGGGILIDIHGQGAAPETIYRGTQNGKTTAHLVKQFGRDALIGEQSLIGQLAKQGFNVAPPVDSRDKEEHYSGGHTVITYGSASGGTLDAIQLELGSDHRAVANHAQTAGKMADAITSFAKNHLPAGETKPAVSNVSKSAGKVAVGVYIDKGTGASANDLLRVLGRFDQVSVTKLTAEQIRAGGLAGLDVLMHPGGSGGGQGRNLDEPGREKIRNFVRDGGGFIGICAGAYLATAHYPWSLDLLDAKVIDAKHWNRGIGTVDIELTPAGREILRTPNQRFPIHYAQGPLLTPANRPDIEDYEEMAGFKTEIAKNDAPQGVMIGTTAIARGRFGQGCVICFSPHPEMTAGLEALVLHAIDSVNRKLAGK